MYAAASAAVGLLGGTTVDATDFDGGAILLLVSRFVVAKRRSTLPEHMLVADEEPAEAGVPGHPAPPTH